MPEEFCGQPVFVGEILLLSHEERCAASPAGNDLIDRAPARAMYARACPYGAIGPVILQLVLPVRTFGIHTRPETGKALAEDMGTQRQEGGTIISQCPRQHIQPAQGSSDIAGKAVFLQQGADLREPGHSFAPGKQGTYAFCRFRATESGMTESVS